MLRITGYVLRVFMVNGMFSCFVLCSTGSGLHLTDYVIRVTGYVIRDRCYG